MSIQLVDLDALNTGDIILFSDKKFWFSRLVEYFTSSDWSHVGVVLRDPTYIREDLKGLYLWESGAEDYVDAEDNKLKFGVQINSLEKKLEEGYNGMIVYRKLTANIENLETKIKIIHDSTYNKPYDLNLADLAVTTANMTSLETDNSWKNLFWNWFKPSHRKVDSFFCSALVGYIYTQLGLLPHNVQWTRCNPKFFSCENDSLELINGKLGDEIVLYNK